MDHAVLSPSSAHRWLSCTPSARYEAQFPDRGSDAAAEGTTAHKLAEIMLKEKYLGQICSALDYEALRISPYNGPEMADYVKEYVAFVEERFNGYKHPVIFLEETLDLTDYVPQGFGTGDVSIISDGILELIDLKYGKGVKVSADANKQLKLYGLGALKKFGFLHDVHTVRLTIYQPRISNFSSWDISVQDLEKWAEQELIPKAKQAFDGIGLFHAGDHCKFCKAAAVCRAHAEHQLSVAKYDFQQPDQLTPEEISDIMRRSDSLKAWLTLVDSYALDQALNNEVQWPGFKLVEGRSIRKYADPVAVKNHLLDAGYSDTMIYEEPSLKTITAMEKTLGKKLFVELLSDLVVKAPGKPALVEETDPRPAYHSGKAAAADFG